jgi:hypothetical protein
MTFTPPAALMSTSSSVHALKYNSSVQSKHSIFWSMRSTMKVSCESSMVASKWLKFITSTLMHCRTPSYLMSTLRCLSHHSLTLPDHHLLQLLKGNCPFLNVPIMLKPCFVVASKDGVDFKLSLAYTTWFVGYNGLPICCSVKIVVRNKVLYCSVVLFCSCGPPRRKQQQGLFT